MCFEVISDCKVKLRFTAFQIKRGACFEMQLSDSILFKQKLKVPFISNQMIALHFPTINFNFLESVFSSSTDEMRDNCYLTSALTCTPTARPISGQYFSGDDNDEKEKEEKMKIPLPPGTHPSPLLPVTS